MCCRLSSLWFVDMKDWKQEGRAELKIWMQWRGLCLEDLLCSKQLGRLWAVYVKGCMLFCPQHALNYEGEETCLRV